MDLQDQLKKLFPDHKPSEENPTNEENLTNKEESSIWLQDDPLICKFEKRKGRPLTVIEGYTGAIYDFKELTSEIKKLLSVGGTFKNDKIIIQGDFRAKIMEFLKQKGFKVKRVGG